MGFSRAGRRTYRGVVRPWRRLGCEDRGRRPAGCGGTEGTQAGNGGGMARFSPRRAKRRRLRTGSSRRNLDVFLARMGGQRFAGSRRSQLRSRFGCAVPPGAG